MKLYSLASALIALVLFVPARDLPAGEIDTALLDRLRAEGIPAWKQLAEAADGVEVECQEVSKETYPDKATGQQTSREFRITWKLCWDPSHGRRLLEYHTAGTTAWSCQVVNAGYRFKVIRTQEGGPYQLLSCGRLTAGDGFDTFDRGEGWPAVVLHASTKVIGVPLSTLVSSPEFRLSALRDLPGKGGAGRRVRVECEYLGPLGPFRRAGGHYWVELSPEDRWSIQQGGIRQPAQGREETQEVTYRRSSAGIPFVKALKYTDLIRPGRYREDRTAEVSPPVANSRPEEEFYLPHYGISESVVGIQSPWQGPRLLLFAVGVVGLAAAVWLARRAWRAE
jgi:hypothetical protein